MAKVTITVEDKPNGQLEVFVGSDSSPSKDGATPAEIVGFRVHEFVSQLITIEKTTIEPRMPEGNAH